MALTLKNIAAQRGGPQIRQFQASGSGLAAPQPVAPPAAQSGLDINSIAGDVMSIVNGFKQKGKSIPDELAELPYGGAQYEPGVLYPGEKIQANGKGLLGLMGGSR